MPKIKRVMKVWIIPYVIGKAVDPLLLVGKFAGTNELCPIGGSIMESYNEFYRMESRMKQNLLLIQNVERELREEAGIIGLDLATCPNASVCCFRWRDDQYSCNAAVYFVDISHILNGSRYNGSVEKFLTHTNGSRMRDKEIACTVLISKPELMKCRGANNSTSASPGTGTLWHVFEHFLRSRVFASQYDRIVSS